LRGMGTHTVETFRFLLIGRFEPGCVEQEGTAPSLSTQGGVMKKLA